MLRTRVTDLSRYMTAFALILTLTILGCETENPLCTDNYCVTGEIFPKEDLPRNAKFKELPATFSEQKIIDLFTIKTPGKFKPVTITGKLDWDFLSENWQYRENGVTYLKKVTVEPYDEGEFGENRTLLVILNKHTVHRDANFREHVDFLEVGTVRLTEWVAVGTFKGNIVGAPTKR